MKLLICTLLALAGAFAQTASYPAAIALDSDLMIAKNRFTAKLTGPLAASDTTLLFNTVKNGPPLVNMLISIDDEVMHVVSVAGNAVQVERGFDGTTAAAHNANAAVGGNIVAWHHNAMANHIKAIETTLGVNGSAPRELIAPNITDPTNSHTAILTGPSSVAVTGTTGAPNFALDVSHDWHGPINYDIGVLGQVNTPAGSPVIESDGIFSNVTNGNPQTGPIGTNAVGLAAHVRAGADGVSNALPNTLFGINTLLTDQNSGTNSGHNFVKMLGWEADFNPNGPSTEILGITLGGNGTVAPVGSIGLLFEGFQAAGPWQTGVLCMLNGVNVCIQLDPLHVGNDQPSSSLLFNSKTASGIVSGATILQDSSPQLALTSFGGVGLYADSPARKIAEATPGGLIVRTSLQIPAIKSTTGTRYVCVDVNGTITSQASACSGT